jgi:hypothetical protein
LNYISWQKNLISNQSITKNWVPLKQIWFGHSISFEILL